MKLSDFSMRLSKNGWHRRLQLYTFGSEVPLFANLCPFFWLTIAACFVSPFKALLMGLLGISNKGVSLSRAVVNPPVTVVKKLFTKGYEHFSYEGHKKVKSFKAKTNTSSERKKVSHLAGLVAKMSDEKMAINIGDFANQLYWFSEYHFSFLEHAKFNYQIFTKSIWLMDGSDWDEFENEFIGALETRDISEKSLKRAKEMFNIIKTWRMVTLDWELRIPELKEMYDVVVEERRLEKLRVEEEEQVAAKLLAEKEAANRAFYIKLSNTAHSISKMVGYAVCGIGIGAGLYFAGHFLFFANGLSQIASLLAAAWGGFLVVLGMLPSIETVLGVIGIAMIILFPVLIGVNMLTYLVDWNLSGSEDESRFEIARGKFTTSVSNVLGFVFAPFEIFWMYALAVKKKQCPGIDWKDD